MSSAIDKLILAEGLPDDYRTVVERHWRPLADRIADLWLDGRPRLIAVNGAQGSGKTTLCRFLEVLLVEHNLRTVTLSLDDLYLTRAEREDLAAHEHPADVRRDRGQDEGERHVVGADDGGEGIVLWHGGSRSSPANTCARGRSSDFLDRLGETSSRSPQRACAGFSPASQILPSGPAAPSGAAGTSGHLVPVASHDSVTPHVRLQPL